MVYVTGDTHGDFRRFSTKSFPEQKDMTKDDHVIILGDFSGVWDYGHSSKDEEYWLDWLNEKPFTTLFLDGNHENFDRLNSEFPEEDWGGGKVDVIRPSILHLKRGEIYDINGKSYFAFGGGKSHDIEDGILEPGDPRIKSWAKQGRHFRVDHMSWWKDEMPSEEEMRLAHQNLTKHGNKVDFILTHSPSTFMINAIRGCSDVVTVPESATPNELTDFLAKIQESVEYERWLCGHIHIDLPCGFVSDTMRTNVLDDRIYECGPIFDGLVV